MKKGGIQKTVGKLIYFTAEDRDIQNPKMLTWWAMAKKIYGNQFHNI